MGKKIRNFDSYEHGVMMMVSDAHNTGQKTQDVKYLQVLINAQRCLILKQTIQSTGDGSMLEMKLKTLQKQYQHIGNMTDVSIKSC